MKATGDDEALKIKFDQLSLEVEKVVFVVTIHNAALRRQSFGQVSGAFIRLVKADNQLEVARYDLTEDASTETSMLFGEPRESGSFVQWAKAMWAV